MHAELTLDEFVALVEAFVNEPDLPPPDIYFCGPKPLSRQLETIAHARGLRYREEHF